MINAARMGLYRAAEVQRRSATARSCSLIVSSVFLKVELRDSSDVVLTMVITM